MQPTRESRSWRQSCRSSRRNPQCDTAVDGNPVWNSAFICESRYGARRWGVRVGASVLTRQLYVFPVLLFIFASFDAAVCVSLV